MNGSLVVALYIYMKAFQIKRGMWGGEGKLSWQDLNLATFHEHTYGCHALNSPHKAIRNFYSLTVGAVSGSSFGINLRKGISAQT